MDSSRNSRLTPLQRDLVEAIFAREQRFFLTGGGALVGYFFGHRDTEDIDLFALPGPDLEEVGREVEAAVTAVGATATLRNAYPDFRRYDTRREEEECLVDLVIDRAPQIDPDKNRFGAVRVDTLREIAANKICTLLSRSEIKDLIDLRELVASGIDLDRAFDDAERKDRGADPATLAWILDELRIGPEALLPGAVDPAELDRFRADFATRLRALAFARARRGPA